MSPVLFSGCLDSEYAANATQGASQVHKNAVQIEKGKQLYREEARRLAHGLRTAQALLGVGTTTSGNAAFFSSRY